MSETRGDRAAALEARPTTSTRSDLVFAITYALKAIPGSTPRFLATIETRCGESVERTRYSVTGRRRSAAQRLIDRVLNRGGPVPRGPIRFEGTA